MPSPSFVRTLVRSPQAGLTGVLLVLWGLLALAAGSHQDPLGGGTVNNFLNAHTLIQMATDASGFAIMGVGATIVIISGGIDLSVGATMVLMSCGISATAAALPSRANRSIEMA